MRQSVTTTPLAAGALMLFLAACAHSAADEPPVSATGEPHPRPGVHEGRFTTELWRVRSFTPCGSERSWWVEGELGPVMELIGSVPRQDLGTPYQLFVRWRGSVVPGAGTAHMGQRVDAFVVDSVLEVRWAAESDCARRPLARSNLQGLELRHADLTEADLSRANPAGAQLFRPSTRVAPMETEPIRCRVHLHSSPAAVYRALVTPEGRARFWAAAAPEADGSIEFSFFNGQQLRSTIREQIPARRFVLEYFGGSTAAFDLEDDGAGGTDLTLTETGVPVEEWAENRAGWVSVLLALKSALDLDTDLRNRDPRRTWDQGYVDV